MNQNNPCDEASELRALYELFDACNETEVYQIARRAGLAVKPNTPKPALIHYILGSDVVSPLQGEQEIDLWRLTIMQFILDHRKKLEAQLSCPARSMDPRACFGCVDAQVVSCLVHNKTSMPQLVQIKKKLATGQ